MARLALYFVCAAGLAVVGARMIHWTAVAHAQNQEKKEPRDDDQHCDDLDAHRPEVPPLITEPAKEGEEKSPIVKALLELVDEFDGDGEHNNKENRELIRRVLREADPELSRSLGKNTLRIIAEANCKPVIYLDCHEPRVRRDDEEKEDDNKDAADDDKKRDEDRECKYRVLPKRVGTVENPIPPKNDPRKKLKNQPPVNEPAGKPAGEDPFGIE